MIRRRRPTIAWLMGLVLGSALVCSVVKQINAFEINALAIGLLLVAFIDVALIAFYVYGIFRAGRCVLRAIKRWAKATEFGSQGTVDPTGRE